VARREQVRDGCGLHAIIEGGGVGERLKPAVLKNKTSQLLSC